MVARSTGAARRAEVAVLATARARTPERLVLVDHTVLSTGRLMDRRMLSVVRLPERMRVLSTGRLRERMVLSAGRLMDRRRLSVVRKVLRPVLSAGRLAERRVVVVTRLTERPVLSTGRLADRRGGSLARESLMRDVVRPIGSIRRLRVMPVLGSVGLLVDLLTGRLASGCLAGGLARVSSTVPLRVATRARLSLHSDAWEVSDGAVEMTGAVDGRSSDFVGVVLGPGGAGDGMPASASAFDAAALILCRYFLAHLRARSSNERSCSACSANVCFDFKMFCCWASITEDVESKSLCSPRIHQFYMAVCPFNSCCHPIVHDVKKCRIP
jgi:hypothetical protein